MRVGDDKDSNPRPMAAWDAVSKDRGEIGVAPLMSQKTGKWRWPAELGGPLASRNERKMRLSWDFHMAPSTNRLGRQPFKLAMLGSNPAGVRGTNPNLHAVCLG